MKKRSGEIAASLKVDFMRIAEDLDAAASLAVAAHAKWKARKVEENARLYILAYSDLRRCISLAEKATREGVFIPASFAPDEVALAE